MLFRSTVLFREAKFHSTVDFWKSNFSDTLDFDYAVFENYAGFQDVRLPRYLKFTNVKDIAKEIDLTNCKPPAPGKKCVIDLAGSDIRKIKMRYDLFQIDTSNAISEEQREAVYENLLSKFKQDGFNKSYKDLDVEYTRFKDRNNVLYRCADFVSEWWWYYGYEKYRIVSWTLMFLTIFLIITAINYVEITKVYYPKVLQAKEGTGDHGKILHAFFLTSILFFGIKLDLDSIQSPPSRWTIYIFVVYFMGLVCTAYILHMIVTI